MYKIMGEKKHHFLINLNWECQNKCPECWEVILGREEGLKPFDIKSQTWDKWLKTLNDLPPSVFDISGGEPTLLEGFEKLIRGINNRNLIALSTNLRGNAVKIIELCGKRFAGINCSWHREQGLSLPDFIERVSILKQKGYPVYVNIVDIPQVFRKSEKELLEASGIKVYISPFEDPQKIRTEPLILECNAGFNTFTVDPQGNVYRCLTWFRYKDRENAYLGNLFNGTFSPLLKPKSCNLRCDIYYILDPLHEQKHMFSTYVTKLKNPIPNRVSPHPLSDIAERRYPK